MLRFVTEKCVPLFVIDERALIKHETCRTYLNIRHILATKIIFLMAPKQIKNEEKSRKYGNYELFANINFLYSARFSLPLATSTKSLNISVSDTSLLLSYEN